MVPFPDLCTREDLVDEGTWLDRRRHVAGSCRSRKNSLTTCVDSRFMPTVANEHLRTVGSNDSAVVAGSRHITCATTVLEPAGGLVTEGLNLNDLDPHILHSNPNGHYTNPAKLLLTVRE